MCGSGEEINCALSQFRVCAEKLSLIAKEMRFLTRALVAAGRISAATTARIGMQGRN
jgi:ABC-type transporter Mla maintaining outer membrane lipid asymmetry permease subunit MlaE